MARTRLGLGGFSRQTYGSFVGKVESAPGRTIGTVTRVGLSGFARPLYGSFAGKSTGASNPRVIGTVTRLGLGGFTRSQYGSFAAKTASDQELIPKGPFICNIGTMMR